MTTKMSRLTRLLLVSAVVGGSANLWAPLYANGFAVWAALLAASLSGVAASTVASKSRLRGFGWLLAALIVAVVSIAVAGGSVYGAWRNLVDGPSSFATLGLFLRASPATLAFPATTCFLTGWVAAYPAKGVRNRVVGAVAVVTVHAIPLLFTTGIGTSTGVHTALLVGALLLLQTALSDDISTDLKLGRPTISAVLVTLLACGMAFGVARAANSSGSLDLREAVAQPINEVESLSPLAQVKIGFVQGTDQELIVFEASVVGLPVGQEIDRFPVAYLDVFDGAVWSSRGVLEPAGELLPAAQQMSPRPTVALELTVSPTENYPMELLPVLGVPSGTRRDDLLWDRDTGALAGAGGPIETYVVEVQFSTADDPAPGFLTSDRNLFAAVLPEMTLDQQAVIDEQIALVPPGDSLERLTSLEERLRSEEFRFARSAPGGSSLAVLISYLGASQLGDAGQAGFSEQSAATFAVLVRAMGLPSRVVVGYRLDQPLSSADSTVSVEADEIEAWPEVWFDQLGWVRFDPTNVENETDDPGGNSASIDAGASAPELTESDPVRVLQSPPAPPPEDAPETEAGTHWFFLALVGLGMFFVSAAAKRLRTLRRRKRSDEAGQVLGAWAELKDRLTDLGFNAGPAETVVEVDKRLALAGIDTAPLESFADAVDVAIYAPESPDAGAGAQAWADAAEALAAARRSTSRGQRVRAFVSPRSLLGDWSARRSVPTGERDHIEVSTKAT